MAPAKCVIQYVAWIPASVGMTAMTLNPVSAFGNNAKLLVGSHT